VSRNEKTGGGVDDFFITHRIFSKIIDQKNQNFRKGGGRRFFKNLYEISTKIGGGTLPLRVRDTLE